MAHEAGEKRKGSFHVGMGIGLILLGIMVGIYLSDSLGGFINPEKAQLVEMSETLHTQNALLKEQIDCLVDGINENNGKTTIDTCT